MKINLNVKVKAGPRTPVEIDVYGTAVNEKIIKFANGKTISDTAIAVWIQENLRDALQQIEHGHNHPVQRR